VHAKPGAVLQCITQPQSEGQARRRFAQLQAAADQRIVFCFQRGDGVENRRRRRDDLQLVAFAELVLGQ
jgi:hypothetical protein